MRTKSWQSSAQYLFILILALGGILLYAAVIPGTAQAKARGTPTPITTNRFPSPPNCTWYAWQKIHDTERVDLQVWGNAKDWANEIQQDGPYAAWSETTNSWIAVQLNNSPVVGDIVVIPGNTSPYTNSSDGHVAYVRSVSTDSSTFWVSEQNSGETSTLPYYNDPDRWSTSQVYNLEGKFIHLVFNSGQSSVSTHNPIVATNRDGRMEVFQIGKNGQLYHQWEDSHGNWSRWASLGGSWPGQPAVGINKDGRLEIFIVGNQGPTGASLFHAWQITPGGVWTNWVPLAGTWPAGTPAVTHNLKGGLEVFMRGQDTNLYHTWQTTDGNSSNYSGWYSLGIPQ